MEEKDSRELFRDLGYFNKYSLNTFNKDVSQMAYIYFNDDLKQVQLCNINSIDIKLLEAINKYIDENGWNNV